MAKIIVTTTRDGIEVSRIEKEISEEHAARITARFTAMDERKAELRRRLESRFQNFVPVIQSEEISSSNAEVEGSSPSGNT